MSTTRLPPRTIGGAKPLTKKALRKVMDRENEEISRINEGLQATKEKLFSCLDDSGVCQAQLDDIRNALRGEAELSQAHEAADTVWGLAKCYPDLASSVSDLALLLVR